MGQWQCLRQQRRLWRHSRDFTVLSCVGGTCQYAWCGRKTAAAVTSMARRFEAAGGWNVWCLRRWAACRGYKLCEVDQLRVGVSVQVGEEQKAPERIWRKVRKRRF